MLIGNCEVHWVYDRLLLGVLVLLDWLRPDTPSEKRYQAVDTIYSVAPG